MATLSPRELERKTKYFRNTFRTTGHFPVVTGINPTQLQIIRQRALQREPEVINLTNSPRSSTRRSRRSNRGTRRSTRRSRSRSRSRSLRSI